ncbi:MAG: hypothetical protein KDJ16_13295, partial [Hyphomicrobiales bacterium]|nr:hypothetical protein [Hyphomicrobiales bacterium]
SLWDRLFGTYRAAPKAGHSEMTIGLDDFPGSEPTRLDWALLAPFRKKSGSTLVRQGGDHPQNG